MSTEEDYGDYSVEVKYIEAAIEALCSQRPKDEEQWIRKLGHGILNVAIQTKKKYETQRT